MTDLLPCRLRMVTCLAASVALAACSGAVPQTAQSAATRAVSESSSSAQSPPSTLSLSEQIRFAVSDLAQRLGIEEQAILVEAVRSVNWRSGALGCPDPGMSYTQALEPGILIMLKTGNKPYGYHAKTNGVPFFCPLDRVEKPASMSTEDMA